MSIYDSPDWLRELTDTQTHRAEMAGTTDLNRARLRRAESDATEQIALMAREAAAAKASRAAHPTSFPKLTVVDGGQA